jgi:hypothetical protein
MSVEEKTRTSGESPREQTSGPILPTVNPEAEKVQPPKATIPSFVYVMYVANYQVYLSTGPFDLENRQAAALI